MTQFMPPAVFIAEGKAGLWIAEDLIDRCMVAPGEGPILVGGYDSGGTAWSCSWMAEPRFGLVNLALIRLGLSAGIMVPVKWTAEGQYVFEAVRDAVASFVGDDLGDALFQNTEQDEFVSRLRGSRDIKELIDTFQALS